jgi:lipoyl(octanoyl) transferase
MSSVSERVDAFAGRQAPSDGPLVRTLGRSDYQSTWDAMRAFTAARTAETRDEIWLTEHPPIYTVGLAGRLEHYPRNPTQIPLVRVDRGGQITYHGPGQAVVYALVDLRRQRIGVREFVRRLEMAMVEVLNAHGISGYGRVDAPGVYVRRSGVEVKIGALGLKVRNGCTYHGLALNVDMDLMPFAAIDPCGYPGLSVTQLKDFGVASDVAEIGRQLAAALRKTVA